MTSFKNSARLILVLVTSLYLTTSYNACSKVDFQQVPQSEIDRGLACEEGANCSSVKDDGSSNGSGFQATLKIKNKDFAQDPSEPLYINNRQVVLQLWTSAPAKMMLGETAPDWNDEKSSDFSEFVPFELKKVGEGQMRVVGTFKEIDSGKIVVVSDDIFLDTVKPSVVFPGQTDKKSANYLLKAQINDPEPSSGIASLECTDPIAPQGYKNCLDFFKDKEFAKTFSSLKDRTYKVSVKVRDMAGNENIVDNEFIIDANAPIVDWLQVPSNMVLNATSVNLQVRVRDSENGNVSSGLSRVECSVDKGVSWASCSAKPDASSSEVYNLVLPTPDAKSYEVIVRAIDKADNEGRTPVASFTIDRSLPTLTLQINSYFNTSSLVPVSMSSKWPPTTYSVVYTCSVKQNNVEVFKPTNCKEPGFTMTLPDSDKEYTLEASGVFTRPSNPSVTVNAIPVKFMVDSQKPSGVLTLTSAAVSASQLASFNLNVQDVGTGVDPSSIKCYLGPASSKQYVPCSSGGFNYQSLLTSGTYSMSMTAEFKDKAGNEGVSNTVSWVMDLDNPAPQITQAPGQLMLGYSDTQKVDNNTKPTFGFIADASVEASTGFKCSVSGAGVNIAPVPCVSPWVVSQALTSTGAVTFTVEATDRAGRKGSASYTWMFDKTPPTLLVSGVNPIYNIQTSTVLNFSLSDTESEVDLASVTCLLKSQSQSQFQSIPCGSLSYPQPATSKIFAVGSASTSNTTEDTYYFKVTGKNIWGMAAESNTVSWTVQNQNITPGRTDLTINENKDVDILFVVDNSASMAGKIEYIGSRFQDFIDRLEGVNWRLGFTSTTVAEGMRVVCTVGPKSQASMTSCLIPGKSANQNIAGGIGKAFNDQGHGLDGRLLDIEGYPSLYWLDKSVGNVNTLFKNTIEYYKVRTTGPYKGDANGIPADPHERALTAVKKSLERAKDGSFAGINKNFFRDGAQLAVVVVTDEDETAYFQVDRDSKGVDRPEQVAWANTSKYIRYCKSNPSDLRCPIFHTEVEEMLSYLKDQYPQKNVIFHSVVEFPDNLKELKDVKPGSAKYAEFDLKWQNACSVKYGGPGCRYRDISQKTGGEIINVGMGTAADYSENLKAIGQGVRNLVNSVKLSCVPYRGQVKVSKDGVPYVAQTGTLNADTLKFAQDLPVGVFRFDYFCP